LKLLLISIFMKLRIEKAVIRFFKVKLTEIGKEATIQFTVRSNIILGVILS